MLTHDLCLQGFHPNNLSLKFEPQDWAMHKEKWVNYSKFKGKVVLLLISQTR